MSINDTVRISETATVTKPAKYLGPNMELRNVRPGARSEPAFRWIRPELKAIVPLQLRWSECVLFSDSGSLRFFRFGGKKLCSNYTLRRGLLEDLELHALLGLYNMKDINFVLDVQV